MAIVQVMDVYVNTVFKKLLRGLYPGLLASGGRGARTPRVGFFLTKALVVPEMEGQI